VKTIRVFLDYKPKQVPPVVQVGMVNEVLGIPEGFTAYLKTQTGYEAPCANRPWEPWQFVAGHQYFTFKLNELSPCEREEEELAPWQQDADAWRRGASEYLD